MLSYQVKIGGFFANFVLPQLEKEKKKNKRKISLMAKISGALLL